MKTIIAVLIILLGSLAYLRHDMNVKEHDAKVRLLCLKTRIISLCVQNINNPNENINPQIRYIMISNSYATLFYNLADAKEIYNN